jgi:hypothetical protein
MMIFSLSLFSSWLFFLRNRKKEKKEKLCSRNNMEVEMGGWANFFSIFIITTITQIPN